MLIAALMYQAAHHESKRLITIAPWFDIGPVFCSLALICLFFPQDTKKGLHPDMTACMFLDKLQALTIADYFRS